MAMILHPLPQLGGNMNNPVTYQLYQTFLNRGFTVLRFNFRGVGKSQGTFDHGVGELSDAASALDWLQSFNPDAKTMLARRIFFWRMDWHATIDAPP